MELGEWKDLQILEQLEDWSDSSSEDANQSPFHKTDNHQKTKPISLSSIRADVVITDTSPNTKETRPNSLFSTEMENKAFSNNQKPLQHSESVTMTITPSSPTLTLTNGSISPSPDKKSESRLEATFTHSNPVDSDQPPTKPSKGYRALTVASVADFKSSSSTSIMAGRHSNSDSDKRLTLSSTEHLVSDTEEENVFEALLNFVLTCFGPLWALGMTYWHFSLEAYSSAGLTAIGLLISVLVTTLVYIIPKNSCKREVWARNKFVALLCLIPGFAPIILSFCNIIFAGREAGCRSFERPWRGTRSIFLAESLALAFPQFCLHLVILVEDAAYLHTYQGYATILGLIIFSFSITFARFRYDSQFKIDRFGLSYEKWIRFLCLWANKCLWLSTFTLTLLSFRLAFPTHSSGPVMAGIGVMFGVHELPILLLVCPPLERRVLNVLGGLMMIPQFTALTVLLVWVNLNPGLYSSETGSMLLGVFFWSELVILTGWLYDRCTGRDVDILPFYPHFLGDICTNLRA